jgi:hypothetical protein
MLPPPELDAVLVPPDVLLLPLLLPSVPAPSPASRHPAGMSARGLQPSVVWSHVSQPKPAPQEPASLWTQ